MPTNLKPYNDKKQPHGLWEVYYPSGELDYRGEFINGIRHGPWEYYLPKGILWYRGTFDMDKKVGLKEYLGEKIFYAN